MRGSVETWKQEFHFQQVAVSRGDSLEQSQLSSLAPDLIREPMGGVWPSVLT